MKNPKSPLQRSKPSPTAELGIPTQKLDQLARSSKFQRRAAKKLSARNLIQALLICGSSGYVSFRQLAIELGILSNQTLSRQNLWERLSSQSAVDFIQSVASHALQTATNFQGKVSLPNLPDIGRILVGDSSTFTFHPRHVPSFPGATNQYADTSQCRFQLTFDLLHGKWLQARVDPYNRTDRIAAYDILSVVRAGDLIIRDLGYAVTDSFRRIQEQGAYFLSRYSHAASIWNDAGQKYNLLELARRHAPNPGDFYTMQIRFTSKHRFPCRIVIAHAGPVVGNQRRRRLNEEAGQKSRNLPGKTFMLLQDWTILITNLSPDQASNEQLEELYRLRWRIENIFRLLKSQTAIRKICMHNTNIHHVQVMLWGWVLLMILQGNRGVFALVQQTSGKDQGRSALQPMNSSIFKSIERWMGLQALRIQLAEVGCIDELIARLSRQADYHDRYESRRRTSIPDRLARVLGLRNSAESESLP